MNEPALLDIKGFRSAHYFDRKHYKHWGKDLSGVTTDEQYLQLARRVGREAARRLPGTHVARRGNNDLIVCAATVGPRTTATITTAASLWRLPTKKPMVY